MTRVLPARLGLLALLSLAVLAGCASRPNTPPPQQAQVHAPPNAKAAARPAIRHDQFRLSLPFSVTATDPSGCELTIDALDATLHVEGAPSALVPKGDGRGSANAVPSASPELVFEMDTRSLDVSVSGPGGPTSASYRHEGSVRASSRDGRAFVLPLAAEGNFDIVREPLFRITSIRIERDLLVTTGLKLMLEIENPNAFPVRLEGLDWKLAGEGRYWAGGRSEEGLEVPAGGVKSRGIAFEMNFANMDRRLFDLVAKLREVRYRFSGEATIASGREGIPAFVTAFDEAGSCAVER